MYKEKGRKEGRGGKEQEGRGSGERKEREERGKKNKQELKDLVHKRQEGKEIKVLSTQGEAWHWLSQDTASLSPHSIGA